MHPLRGIQLLAWGHAMVCLYDKDFFTAYFAVGRIITRAQAGFRARLTVQPALMG